MKKLIIFILMLISFDLFSQGFSEYVSKVYKIKYKPIEEIIPLAQSLLSKKGKLVESPKLDLFSVTDYPQNILQIDSLVIYHDIPYRQIELQVLIGEGFNDEDENDVNQEISTVLGDRFAFNNIILVDKGSFLCEEKSETTLKMGNGDYSFVVFCEHMGGEPPVIKFHNVSLSKYVTDVMGRSLRELFSTTTQINNNVYSLISASGMDDSGRTLFLIVKAILQ